MRSLNSGNSPAAQSVAAFRVSLARAAKTESAVELAGKWLAGRIDLDRSVANAIAIFRISKSRFYRERGGKRAPDPDRLTRAWQRALESERRAFVAANADLLWNELDAVTAPPKAPLAIPHLNGARARTAILG